MLPEMTIEMTTTAAMEAADSPEELRNLAKCAIMELSKEERAELLERWGECNCLRQKNS